MDTKKRKSPIPLELLMKMGTCEVIVHGVKVTVHVADCSDILDKRFAEFRAEFFNLSNKTKVVGLDLKKLKCTSNYIIDQALVLCISRRCLIIYFKNINYTPTENLKSFLQDTHICFVGSRGDPHSLFPPSVCEAIVSVKVGELAGRVLRKPALMRLSLADLAREVEVSYDGPTSCTTEMCVNSTDPPVLDDAEVVKVISDAYAYFQIGYKLLDSL